MNRILELTERNWDDGSQGYLFYSAKVLGRTMAEVAVDILEHPADESEILSRWFHSALGVDLFVWMDPAHEIIRQQACVNGQIVQWDSHSGLQTGMVIETDMSPKGEGGQASEPAYQEEIRVDSDLNQHTLNQTLAVLHEAQAVDEALRAQVLKKFSRP